MVKKLKYSFCQGWGYKTTKGQTFLRFDLVYRRLNLRLSELADVSSQF